MVLHVSAIRAPRAKYTMVGEAVRYVIPEPMQCSLGCGGQACKYDNPSCWSEEVQAIRGLYSAWVTDHLLAMSRPSTEIIEKYNIIDQFKRNGIKTVINLQKPGEHASCGNPLEPDSGFSYRPEVFMENDIYFYNFVWEDYGVANHAVILDMMKVLAFAMQEGKIAVHCHAGLGRTGVLLACFLAYATRMTADQAILYVRAKRPDSIQTRGQLQCVRKFVKFLDPLRSIFSCAKPCSSPVTLRQFLVRQRDMLHGVERRNMRHLPKIIQLVSRLLVDIAEHREVIEEEILEAPDISDVEMSLSLLEKMERIPSALPRLPGPPILPRHYNEPAIFYHRKSLSYSDSDLRRLGSELNLLAQPMTSLSQGNVNMMPARLTSLGQGHKSGLSMIYDNSKSSLWEQKNLTHENGSLLLKRKLETLHRRGSLGNDKEPPRFGGLLFRWKTEQRAGAKVNARECQGGECEESEVPFITLQTELSLDARRLLVAQALAVDLIKDGEDQHRHRVSVWQSELNQGGAWERLCMERDPFILTGLMWAWLEQLKEPAIDFEAATSLNPNDTDSQTILNTLDQAPRNSLVCILDCMAHLLSIPEDVENAFLRRTIKAFTKLEDNSEGRGVYETMAAVLRFVLKDLRQKAIEEDEAANVLLSAT
ncbi:Protein tyrosine phosphatase domain-containing protein 1 [Merluccius polli]|uniref:Protein tyrosine phosphatase domain-containing protein 1 n=1 Tax=Merluccius polli TaxID=89951 RepID=A0AA47P5Z0_MERPO|nr:Protein tyrosine phosphatase domain-containing protein 1 [Merluccius polli]